MQPDSSAAADQAPFHRTPIATLRQERTSLGYAAKALLAQSVLACGCAPHAACDRVHDGARRRATMPPGDRYTVSLRNGASAALVPGRANEKAKTKTVRACSALTTEPRAQGSGICRKTAIAQTQQ
jgi:hypothetical protein